jgi:hypothetical protein
MLLGIINYIKLFKLTDFNISSAFDDANEVSRHAALKYRAEMIAEYETIDNPFGNQNGNSRYIYFTSKADYIEKWLKRSEKARESHNNFLAEIYNDYDDSDNDDYNNDNKRKNWNQSQDYSYASPIVGIPLSLYWFVDEDENNKKFQPSLTTSSIIRFNNTRKEKIYNEVKILQEKVHHLIYVLQS